MTKSRISLVILASGKVSLLCFFVRLKFVGKMRLSLFSPYQCRILLLGGRNFPMVLLAFQGPLISTPQLL